MRKFLAIVFAASFLWGGALCFAAEKVKPKAVSSPEAAPQQSTQNKTQRPSQRTMHRMRKTGGGKSSPDNSAAPEAAPNPSQRSMRQKLKAVKPVQAPETANPEPR